MNWKRFFIEAATLVLAATLCALTANALASRERKVAVIPTSVEPRPVTAAPPVETTTVAPVAPALPPAQTATTTATTATVAPKPRPKPVEAQPVVIDVAKFKPHPSKAYIEIHGDDVAALHKSGALFLDARRTSVYEQGHIAGARPYSVWEADVDEKVRKLYDERSDPSAQEKPIVIYCSGGDCEDSHMLAEKLWGIQFNNVYVYKDGFPDWQKRGGATHTGANP